MLISQDNLIEELRNKLSPIKNLISLQQLLKKGITEGMPEEKLTDLEALIDSELSKSDECMIKIEYLLELFGRYN